MTDFLPLEVCAYMEIYAVVDWLCLYFCTFHVLFLFLLFLKDTK